jgi:curved DNA-binding protein
VDYKDYYKIMGLDKNCSQDEVKRAYKKLARKYHPDVNSEADAESHFKELGEAYAVLKDTEKRAAYDQLGADWQSGQDFTPPPGWDSGFEYSGGNTGSNADFSDFFESLFGQPFGSGQAGRQYRPNSTRGEDRHAKVSIDLGDAYQGATRSVTLQSAELDQQGRIVNKQRTLKIKIPKGVKQGQRIRLTGQGGPGFEGAPRGDLYLEIEFNPHAIYRVDQHDVYLDLPVAPWEAALGATIKVPTPSGSVDLSIAAGTKSNQKLRLKGRGIPAKSPGDLYAVIKIALPPADTDEAKAIYRKMQTDLAFNPRSSLGV